MSQVPGRTFLAPMEGVGHPAFRHLIASGGGVDVVCTEFVRITQDPPSAAHLKRLTVVEPGCKLSVQVMGNCAPTMARAAEFVSQAGADIVDINMGCPMPKVVKKGVGAAMLKDPQLLFDVVATMRQAAPRLLSAKIRAGYEDTDSVLTNALLVQAAGADFITVHPRRRCDFYSGVSDWRIIARLKRELDIPVVGNGDIWYACDALRMMQETGCDAVMLGRPAIRNPWIFRQIDALRSNRPVPLPDGQAFVAYVRRAIDAYRDHYSKDNPAGPIKELLRWMTRAVIGAGDLKRRLLRLDHVEDIFGLCERELAQLTHEHFDHAPGGGILEHSGSALSRRTHPDVGKGLINDCAA